MKQVTMYQYDHSLIIKGPTIYFGEGSILIDGRWYAPITVIEAARLWHDYAKKRGWKLRDLGGRPIKMDNFKVTI